ncbi:alpha-L-rhamnosidase [Opitutaceae bacterium TAV1]|nr:alpha-L-rhamnosidase [Opitutaceae bacterium TAV1]
MPSLSVSFIWRDATLRAAPNTWTYFRKVVRWRPEGGGTGARVEFAADPTARVWVNGRLVLDRVLRFVTPQVSVETLDLSPHLVTGDNVLVVLHHWWGVPTFQRSPGGRAGISFVWEGNAIVTDATWHWRPADEFTPHSHQTIGHDGSRRIRFPVLLDTRLERPAIHTVAGDAHPGWLPAVPVASEAWARSVAKETPPLTLDEYVRAARLVSAGRIMRSAAVEALPLHEIGRRIRETAHRASLPPPSGDAPPAADTGLEMQAGSYVTLDFARPVHGYLTLEVSDAPAGAILEFGYGELSINPRDTTRLLSADGHFDPEFTCGTPFGDRVVLRGGPQTVALPEERTWRYLLLHRPAADGDRTPARITVSCRSSRYPAITVGGFRTEGDGRIASLVERCLDHARVSMSDTYVDTPGREDAQWLEDIQYRARISATWFGDTALRQVTLRHAAEQQDLQTGLFRVFAPEDHKTAGCQLLDWGMAWIGLLHDDWRWTGSTALLRRYYPNLKRFLSVLDGLAVIDGLLTGQKCLADNHGSARLDHAKGEAGCESIPNTWYHGYLLQSAEMADALGEAADAGAYRRRADHLRASFRRFLAPIGGGVQIAELWTPADGPRAWGQSAVVNALYHGLIPDRATARAMLRAAFPESDGIPPADSVFKRWNTPTTIYRALRVLCEHGLGPLAAAHLAATYGPHLPDGPLPEYFLFDSGRQPLDPTGSHGWAAVPLAWLHDTVLGVRFQSAAPGVDAHIAVTPHYVGWDHVSGAVLTPAGLVTVCIDWPARSLAVSGPQGTRLVRAFVEEIKPSEDGPA